MLLLGFATPQGKIKAKTEANNSQPQTQEDSVDWKRLENSFYMAAQKDYKLMVSSKKFKEITEFKGFVLVDRKWVSASFDRNKMIMLYMLGLPNEEGVRSLDIADALAKGTLKATESLSERGDSIKAVSYVRLKDGSFMEANVVISAKEKQYYLSLNTAGYLNMGNFMEVGTLLQDANVRKQLTASDLDLSKTTGYAIDRTAFYSARTFLFSDGEHEYFLFLDCVGYSPIFTDWYPMPDKDSEIYNDPALDLRADFKSFVLYAVKDVYTQVSPILAAETRLQLAQEREYLEKRKREKDSTTTAC